MTLKEALQQGTMMLEAADVIDASLDAWYLLEKAAKIDKQYYYLHIDEELTEEQQIEYEETVKKRCERIPLQYITGETEFMGFPFKVNPNVLIPRQDTETLVEEALKVIGEKARVLDMCTGSGCILISLMKMKEDIIGVGVDNSRLALNTAMENARLNDVVAEWEMSNLFANISEEFDVIVSNPPYIPSADILELMPEVREFEPMSALDGTEDGLYFYREITAQAAHYLTDEGYLLFEIGYDQGEAVSSLMAEAHFLDIEVIKDLAENDRVVMGHL